MVSNKFLLFFFVSKYSPKLIPDIYCEIFFYAIKAISKSFVEKQKFGVKYLFYEKKKIYQWKSTTKSKKS